MSNVPGVSLTAATGRYRAEYKGKYLGTYATSVEAEEIVLKSKQSFLSGELMENSARLGEIYYQNHVKGK